MAEHDRIQLVWVLGHMGIDGNEIVDHLTGKAPQIHVQDLKLSLAYLQRLPVE